MDYLKDNEFIDLYIGCDYTEIKGLMGADKNLITIPVSLIDDTKALQAVCKSRYESTNRTEFSVLHDSRLYRVTVTGDLYGGVNFTIRQTPNGIRTLETIPVSSHLRTSIDIPEATGLFLIAGQMGSGKTTTAAAVLKRRIEVTGNLGVSIEDPAETFLMGRHGEGRCMQLEVSGDETYASATKKAYRMGASSFLLGEIRDGATAHEVLKASLSMFVVSTIHASSVLDAIERYVMFCEEFNQNAKSNVANTLYAVAYQSMNSHMKENKIASRSVDIVGFNLRNATTADTIRSKIAAGQFLSLNDDFRRITYKF